MPEFGAQTKALEVVEGICLKGKDAIVTGNWRIIKNLLT
jgi:hypothetical protein